MNSFSKLYLLSPESYNKLVLDKMVHQGLDRDMYNVLNMKKISDAKKWYLYRDLLNRFANKARNNKRINEKPLNVIEPHVNETRKKKSPLKYSVQSQTNIVRRARVDQNNQTENSKNEMSIQTDPIMEETIYELNPADSYYENNADLAVKYGFPYEEGMPGFSSFELERNTPTKNKTSTPRKSVSANKTFSPSSEKSINEQFKTPSAADVAHAILNKSKRSTLRRALTYSGEKEKQLKLNFPVVKIPPFTRAAAAAAAAAAASAKEQTVQTGSNCFKWTCMK